LNGRFAGLNVMKERRDAAVAEKMFKPSASIQYSAVTADSVPAEWIVPIGLSPKRVVRYVHGGAFYSGTLAGARYPVAARQNRLMMIEIDRGYD
jgi:acetyl esterase/lipase